MGISVTTLVFVTVQARDHLNTWAYADIVSKFSSPIDTGKKVVFTLMPSENRTHAASGNTAIKEDQLNLRFGIIKISFCPTYWKVINRV